MKPGGGVWYNGPNTPPLCCFGGWDVEVDPVHLYESGEDYLEAILVLRQEKGSVRSIDVAQHLGFSKPSVSRAMSILRANGYIEMEKAGAITLTPAGEEVARTIYERHRLISQWLVRLGVSPEVAARDACRIEHDLSGESFQCLKRHVEREMVPSPEEEG